MDYQTRLNSDITKEIDYLASLRKQRMVADLRTELVYGSLERLADMICNTVTDWSLPLPCSAAFFRTAMAQSPRNRPGRL
nr:hypothetical protein [Escherichia coli]